MTMVDVLFDTKGKHRGLSVADRIDAQGDCWVWTGATHNHGYGRVGLNRKVVSVHRLVYEALVGEIPEGMHLDHLCLNPPCCNPDHLEVVTLTENVQRSKKPHNMSSKTQCPQGHPYDYANTRLYRKRRYCNACLGCKPNT